MKRNHFIFVVAIVMGITLCRGQQIKVQAPSVVGVGTSFGVSFTVEGKTDRIQPPKTTGLTLVGGPSTSSSTSIRNVGGHQAISQTLTYTYYYRADAEGEATIGEASCVVDGKTLHSAPAVVKVDKNAPQQNQRQRQQRRSVDPWDDWFDPMAQMQQMQQMMGTGRSTQTSQPVKIDDQSLFAQASISNRTPYVGEQVIVSYKVYTQVSLRQFLIDKLPGNKGFWAEDLTGNRREVRQWDETLNSRHYRVAEIRRGALYAQDDGTLRIEPLDLDVLAMVPRQRTASFFDFFDDPFFNLAQAVERHLKTNAIEVHVKPLPDAPDDFCGAVGHFNVTSAIDVPSDIKANEAVTYRVTFTGAGNMVLLTPPSIDFPTAFEVYEPRIDDQLRRSDDGISGSRTFEWVLIPRSQGDYEIPATTVSYFDPKTGQYVRKQLEAVSLHVSPADPRSHSGSGISRIDSDIRHIHTAPATLATWSHFSHAGVSFWILLVAILLGTVCVVVWMRSRSESRKDVVGMRQKRALKEARRRLRQAERHMNDGKDEAFYEEIYKAIWGVLSDKYKIEQSRLSSETVRGCLTELDVDTHVIEDIMQTLQDVDFARFGPGESGTKKQTIYGKALTMIRNLSFTVVLLTTTVTSIGAQELQQANEAYLSGDYTTAIARYEQLIADGYCSPELYSNLGAAYYRDHQRGWAIVNYERSLLLDPTDRPTRESLSFVQAQNTDQVELLPQVLLRNRLYKTTDMLDARAWRRAVLIVLLLLCTLFVVRRMSATSAARRWLSVLLTAVSLLFIFTAVQAWVAQHRITHVDRVVVIQSEAPVHAAPGSGSTLLTVLHEGTEAKGLESDEGWQCVRIDDGTVGWVPTSTIASIAFPY